MNLPELLLALKPLVEEPQTNWDEIVDLLASHNDLAEYEVARYYASTSMEPLIWEKLESLDPRERYEGIDGVILFFSRANAAKILKHFVKDWDRRVALHALHAINILGVWEVALRDTNRPLPRWGHIGGYNPTGWSFGTFRPYNKPMKLARSGVRKKLPKLDTRNDVAKLVGYDSAQDLVRFNRPGCQTGSAYIEFTIPKATGGTRLISAPRPKLRKVQRILLEKLLSKIPVHEAAHGFVKGRSTVTNARPHKGASLILKTDLKDFFPSIHYLRVVGLMEHYGYKREVASELARLTTHRPILDDGRVLWPGLVPQGAPTSPSLANIVCRRLDSRLTGLSKKLGATYTRYADDLTFSFEKEPEKGIGHVFWLIEEICVQEGFRENAKKRKILRPSSQQRVTGIVVNERIQIPRKERRRFRAILHNCRKHGIESQSGGRKDFTDYLRGYASYIHMVDPDRGNTLIKEVNDLLKNGKSDEK